MSALVVFFFFCFWLLGFFHILMVMLTIELMLLFSLFNLFNSGCSQFLFMLVLILSVCLGAFGVSMFLEIFRFKSVIHKTNF